MDLCDSRAGQSNTGEKGLCGMETGTREVRTYEISVVKDQSVNLEWRAANAAARPLTMPKIAAGHLRWLSCTGDINTQANSCKYTRILPIMRASGCGGKLLRVRSVCHASTYQT